MTGIIGVFKMLQSLHSYFKHDVNVLNSTIAFGDVEIICTDGEGVLLAVELEMTQK